MAGWAKCGYIIGRYLIAVWVVPCFPMVAISSVFLAAELAASAAALECVRSRLLIISAVGIFGHVLFRLNSISELLSSSHLFHAQAREAGVRYGGLGAPPAGD